MPPPRSAVKITIHPLGDTALLAELGTRLDTALNTRAIALASALQKRRDVRRAVAGHSAVTVQFDPDQITYDALALVGERTGNNPVEELENSIKQLTPVLEVRSRRVGGATYQVPVEVPARRARTLAVRWLVEFARARGEKSMAERLANEVLDASKQQGNAWKRKDDIYRMAQANKAFAHYRW